MPLRIALVLGLIGLQGCGDPVDGNSDSGLTGASTSGHHTAGHDAGDPNPGSFDRDGGSLDRDAGEQSDGGPSRDRDSGMKPDAASTPSDDDSADPPATGITITRTLPEPDRVYVNDTVRIQFLVDGVSDAEVDLVVGDKTLVRLRYPYRYDLDTRTLDEGETTLTGMLHGQHSVASEPLALVIDRTAPVVVTRAPTPNADSVWYRDPMGLTFSEPIVPATVTTSSVRVATASEVLIDAGLKVAKDARSVSIVLEELPEIPATVTISATEAITDLAGNPLTPDSWSFQMPDWVDSPGAPDGEDDPLGYSLAVTDAGEQFLAWVDDDNVVRVARRVSGPWKFMPDWSENDSAIHELVGVVLTDDQQPIVAYIRDLPNDAEGGLPRALRWDGSAWHDLGSPLGPKQYAAPLFLRRDPTAAAASFVMAGGGQTWRVDDTGWNSLGIGGGGQSMSVLPSGAFLLGGKNADGCVVTRVEGSSSTFLGSPSNSVSPCTEAHVAAHPDGTAWVVTGGGDGTTWRYQSTLNPINQTPMWTSVSAVFRDSDPEDVAFNPDGQMFMISRGSTSVNGMVVVDWSAEFGQVIGNWFDTSEALLTFYGNVPVVLRLREVTPPSSVKRRFDLVVSLRNRM